MVSRRFTALCGLYCLDCIPANAEFFAVVKRLNEMLADLQFEQYASLKARGNAVFNDYGTFLQVMQAIAGLECVAPCTEGGCKPSCDIRNCVTGRGLAGCWDCETSSDCGLLRPLKAAHPNLSRHLELIKEHGPEDWIEKRGCHYLWQVK
jgi:hypothetical protein